MHASAIFHSPIGPLFLAASERGIANLAFPMSRRTPALGRRLSDDDRPAPTAGSERHEGSRAERHLREARRQLEAYFAGTRRDFDLPLDVEGSEFQRRVWEQIARIPFGATASYGEVAAAAGYPGASRAAGAACGANRVALIVPCHRVVAADGSLHGFGGGLDTKKWLLEHEGVGSRGSRGRQPALLHV
jgi:methylated-DNA-[protein]-cysteine S-methyltransferase